MAILLTGDGDECNIEGVGTIAKGCDCPLGSLEAQDATFVTVATPELRGIDMTEGGYPSKAALDREELLQQLQERGITDLDSLVQRLVSENQPRQARAATLPPIMLLCNSNFCLVVKSDQHDIE